MLFANAAENNCTNIFHTVGEYAGWGWEKVRNGVSAAGHKIYEGGQFVYEKLMPYLEKLGDWYKDHKEFVWGVGAGAASLIVLQFAYSFFCSDNTNVSNQTSQQSSSQQEQTA